MGEKRFIASDFNDAIVVDQYVDEHGFVSKIMLMLRDGTYVIASVYPEVSA